MSFVRVKNAGYHGIGFTCGEFIHQLAMNKINYYPAWINKYNLRFLYRMYKEPHTRKRYLKAGIFSPFTFCMGKIDWEIKLSNRIYSSNP